MIRPLAFHATGARTTVSLLLADAAQLERFPPNLRYLLLVAVLYAPPADEPSGYLRAAPTGPRKVVAIYLPNCDVVTPLIPLVGSASGAFTWAVTNGYTDLILDASDAAIQRMLQVCKVTP